MPAIYVSLCERTGPSASETVNEAQIGEIYKKAGDTVKADEPILELETDKAAQEVPSPVSGVIRELLVESGDEVKVGALLARIRSEERRVGREGRGRWSWEQMPTSICTSSHQS